ncbi:MAG: nickel-dependent lactate racemase [Desulfobacterales bacterium]|nr:nickel-dependent lactate racemase [Desulfobacterales bacterium]
MKVSFPYPGIPSLEIPRSASISLLEPKILLEQEEREVDIIKKGLENPVGLPRIREMVKGKKKILILVDDYTRNTPIHIILPEVLKEMSTAGINKTDIRVLIASGTHRPMTQEEKLKKVGHRVMADYTVLDHRYNDSRELVQLNNTAGGTKIWVNRAVIESDYVIGIGQIVPHRVAGFSGGGKIIQPGACGAITTGQTHWLSARFPGTEIIGRIDNPIRREIDAVAKAAGLKFIINVVLDGKEKMAHCICGDPIEAFRLGARKSIEIFGVLMPEPVEIVITDSYPADLNLWQAAKGIYSADLALKPGGIFILVTPCPEGVSVEHPQILDIGYHSFTEMESMVKRGEIQDLTLAAHLVHVGRTVCEKATGIIVSPGIEPRIAAKLGFHWAASPQEALTFALKLKGKKASIAVIKNGGETMPVIGVAINELQK